MGHRTGYIAKTRGSVDVLVVEPSATLAPSAEARLQARRYSGQRVAWRGQVSGIAYRTLSGRARAHICLTEVEDREGRRIFARVWFPLGVTLRTLEPERGGLLAFVAGVEEQLDGTYRLIRPSQFERVADRGNDGAVS